MSGAWLGVDVGGERKGFDAALVDDGALLELRLGLRVAGVVGWARAVRPAVVAIDSPCAHAPPGCLSRDSERSFRGAGICGIRFTPDAERLATSDYYGWIRSGLELYAALGRHGIEAIECLPTASWTRWIGPRAGRRRSAWSTKGLAALELAGLPPRTSQDARDAIAAAVTARQFSRAETEAFGEIHVPIARPS